MKVVITGSTGLVGSRVVELLNDDFTFIPLLQSEVDITNKESIASFIKNCDFDICLHLAAYTLVDRAEQEQTLARAINVEGTRNIFQSVRQKGKKFIYISTDYVFNGKSKDNVFYEDSVPNPVGTYGTTKYEGEKIVGRDGMIVRISYPYRASFEQKQDFVRKIKSLLEKGIPVSAITDSSMTPTFIDDIALGLKYLMINYSSEIFHLVGTDTLSPFETVAIIARNFSLNQKLISPITFKEYYKESAEKRPQYTTIASKKNNFYKMRTFKQGLIEISSSIK